MTSGLFAAGRLVLPWFFVGALVVSDACSLRAGLREALASAILNLSASLLIREKFAFSGWHFIGLAIWNFLHVFPQLVLVTLLLTICWGRPVLYSQSHTVV